MSRYKDNNRPVSQGLAQQLLSRGLLCVFTIEHAGNRWHQQPDGVIDGAIFVKVRFQNAANRVET